MLHLYLTETITFTASNGKSATGIIADHMDSDYVGTCERGLWAELKLGEIDVSLWLP